MKLCLSLGLVAIVFASGACMGPELKLLTRAETIPAGAVKVTPEMDAFAPVLHLDGWEQPVPLDGPVNTAGAEDSPFILPDGSALYFVFVPDVNVSPDKQLTDGATGIWKSERTDSGWSEPERVLLNDDLSLDGCPFVQGDTMWFCSARAGNFEGVDVYIAQYAENEWRNWRNAGSQLNKDYDIGEFHLSPDGRELYFGWVNSSGMGERDIWVAERKEQGWSLPVNLGPNVNSDKNEDLPFLSSDGKELWFCGTSRMGYTGPAIFRSSKMEDGSWAPAEEVISNFAGEPTLDDAGNIYFVHHFYPTSGSMIEADIYVAYREESEYSRG